MQYSFFLNLNAELSWNLRIQVLHDVLHFQHYSNILFRFWKVYQRKNIVQIIIAKNDNFTNIELYHIQFISHIG